MPEVMERRSLERPRLTEADVALVRLLGELGTYQAVADEMGLALQTVKNRLSSIYKALEVKGGAAAVYAVCVEGRRDALR